MTLWPRKVIPSLSVRTKQVKNEAPRPLSKSPEKDKANCLENKEGRKEAKDTETAEFEKLPTMRILSSFSLPSL